MAVFSGSFIPNDSNYLTHVFTSSGTFTPTFTGTVEVLTVGGGGGGGMDMGGGGGGGGVVSHTSYSVTAGIPLVVTVGAGGAGAPSGTGYAGLNGSNSQYPWPTTGGQPGSHQFTVSATRGSPSSLGVNLVSDGSFNNGITGWGTYNSSISWYNSNSLRAVATAGNPAGATYYFSTTVGQVYYYKAVVSQSGAAGNDARIQISGIGLINSSTGQSTTSDTKTIYDSFTATSTTHILEILLYNSQSGAILNIDDVEVYPVSSSIVAYGGGLGASSYWGYTPNYGYGGNGGSGGGASGYSDGNTGRGGAATANVVAGGTGYGNAGGGSTGQYYPGGGGGAGGAGGTGNGNGGSGILNRILGQDYYWGGGGGGGGHSSGVAGAAGIGGGGGGSVWSGTGAAGGVGYKNGDRGRDGAGNYMGSPGGDGGANTGGGGGGGSHYNFNNKGGNGGSGIVIIRYLKTTSSTPSPTTSSGNSVMNIYSAPSIILDVDSFNRKSWGGIGTERIGNIIPTFGNWNGLVGTSTSYNTVGNLNNNGVYLNITNNNGGGVNWWYSSTGGMACSSSTRYIISAKIKYSGNTPHPNLFYVRQYNSGGSQTSESGKYTSSQQIDIGNGWYLAWAIFQTDSTATSFYVHGYDYQNIQIWLQDVWCKQCGLADLSGYGNDLVAEGTVDPGPGYGATNFGGNATGSGDRFARTSFPSNLKTSQGGNGLTVMAVAKSTGGVGTWRKLVANADGENYIDLYQHSSSGTWHQDGSGETLYYNAGIPVANDTLYMADSVWRVYWATNSNSGGLSNPAKFSIGNEPSSNAYPWVGNIAMVRLYNRVLTTAEMAQAFYAVRGRFNI